MSKEFEAIQKAMSKEFGKEPGLALTPESRGEAQNQLPRLKIERILKVRSEKHLLMRKVSFRDGVLVSGCGAKSRKPPRSAKSAPEARNRTNSENSRRKTPPYA